MNTKTRIYGKNTTKLFQVRLKEVEYYELIDFINYLDITRRNFILRFFGIAKKIIARDEEKKYKKFLKDLNKLRGRG